MFGYGHAAQSKVLSTQSFKIRLASVGFGTVTPARVRPGMFDHGAVAQCIVYLKKEGYGFVMRCGVLRGAVRQALKEKREMKRFNIRLDGATPLLFNRMTDEELERLRTKEKQKFKATPEPREEAQKKLYLTNDTQEPYVPMDMLMKCLINAGIFIKLDGKRQMSTKTSTLLPGFIALEDHYMIIEDPRTPEPCKPANWEVDMRQGRNPNGGEAVCIIRPRFDAWRIRLSMLIDTAQIDASKIRELVDIAGKRMGIGDFRPQRMGIYGQFRIGCWERVETVGEQEAAE